MTDKAWGTAQLINGGGGSSLNVPYKTFVDASVSPAGFTPGLSVGICAGTELNWTALPYVSEFFPLYTYINSNNGRALIWGSGALAEVTAASDAQAWGSEIRVVNDNTNVPDFGGTNKVKVGVQIVSSGLHKATASVWVSAPVGSEWKYGLYMTGIGSVSGSSVLKTDSTVLSDYGLDLSQGTFTYNGLRIGNTPPTYVGAAAIRQHANNTTTVGIQRFTDSAPTGNMLALENAANTLTLFAVDVTGKIILPTTIGVLWSNGASGVSTLTIGSGLTLVGGTLSATGGGGGSGPFIASGAMNYGVDTSGATIAYQGIRVGNTTSTGVAGIGVRPTTNGTSAIVVQRNTDTSPSGAAFQVIDAAYTTTIFEVSVTGVMKLPTTTGILWSNGSSGVGTATIGTGLSLTAGTLAIDATNNITSFNTRKGAVTLTSGDVTTALTYTPLNTASPTFSGTLTGPNHVINGASASTTGTQISLGNTVATTASAGGAGAPPAAVGGYWVAYYGTTAVKIPYYLA